jgi:hypothetical protein
MNNLKFLGAFLCLSAQAFAWSSGDFIESGNNFCAPEVAEGNLKATERVLTELTAKPELAGAAKFSEFVQKVKKLNQPKEKFVAYMKLVQLDQASVDQIANFLGARDLTPYAAKLEIELGLSAAQSQMVVESLVKALRGNL